jgi:hypothetical protein
VNKNEQHVRSAVGVADREGSCRRFALESRFVNNPFSMDLKPPPDGVGGTGVVAALRARMSSTSEAKPATKLQHQHHNQRRRMHAMQPISQRNCCQPWMMTK